MITAVLPLNDKAQCRDDWETRYLLRSMEKHFLCYEDQSWSLCTVGHRPEWLVSPDNFHHIHLSAKDPYDQPKDANIIGKLLIASSCHAVANQILLVNDDQLFLRPTYSTQLGPYWDMPPKSQGHWGRSWHGGAAMLTRAGFPAKNFETHLPTLMSKRALPHAFLRFPYAQLPGATVNTLYFNSMLIEGSPLPLRNCRAVFYDSGAAEAEIKEDLSSHQFANYNDEALKMPAFVKAVEEMFPEPSIFEL